MDPVSIVALTASCATLVRIICATTEGVQGLVQTYRQADTNVSGLLNRIRVVRYSLVAIERWTRETKAADTELLSMIAASISDFQLLFTNLNKHLKNGEWNTWDRVILVWSKPIIKEYEGSLDSQILALQMLLMATHW